MLGEITNLKKKLRLIFHTDPTVELYFVTQHLGNRTAVRHRQHLVQFIIAIFFTVKQKTSN